MISTSSAIIPGRTFFAFTSTLAPPSQWWYLQETMVDIRPNKEEAWWKKEGQVLKCGLGVKPSKFDLAQRGIILKKVGRSTCGIRNYYSCGIPL
jgi:hypothetical protein